MKMIQLRDSIKKVLTKHGKPNEHFYVQVAVWEEDKHAVISVHCYGIDKGFRSLNAKEIPSLIDAYFKSLPTESIDL